MGDFFAKYRGKVVSNEDPLHLGRLCVTVPDVFGANAQIWAMPCVPYAGPGVGVYTMPPVGANIWVEFELGDHKKPIWSGCFWMQADEVPAESPKAHLKILKTETFSITIDDSNDNGAVTIETNANMKITLNPQGIEISNGRASIKLIGNTVSINEDGLQVT